MQEKTPQCISSRHLTQSSPPSSTPMLHLGPHGYSVPSPVCEGRRLKKREEDSLHLCFSSQTYTTHTHTQSLKCWCHLSGPHHHFAYCGSLSRVNWLGFLWFISFRLLRDTINPIKCVGVECLPRASQRTRHTATQFNCSFGG